MRKVYNEENYFSGWGYRYIKVTKNFTGVHLHNTKHLNLPEYSYEDWLYLFNKSKQENKNTVMKPKQKKIIGYKLVKPEYEEAALKIAGLVNWSPSSIKLEYQLFRNDCVEKVRNAGVLDLWFEPVYEEAIEFKVGDWVTCVSGFTNDWNAENSYEGAGYKENYTFKIDDFRGDAAFEKNNNCGVYTKALRKAIDEEIKKLQTTTSRIGGEDGFDLTIKHDGIFHKTENITKFVESIYSFTHLFNFGYSNTREKYDFIVKDIILSKTGCESKESKISEWIECYKKYLELKK